MSQFIRLAVPRQQKATANSIVINATPAPFTVSNTGALFIKPIRHHHIATQHSLYYDHATSEVYYAETSGNFTIDEYWYPDPTDPSHTLTPSGDWTALRLGSTRIYGNASVDVSLNFNGYGGVTGGTFNLGSNANNWHFGYSGGVTSHPAYMIDGDVVADHTGYTQIYTNKTNITILASEIQSLSGDVSNNATCCLDNSQNIWNLTIDVSDNSNNIWLLSGDVSNNTTCCLDNSYNIWQLTLDVSDNSYNIFDLSAEVQDLSSHAHAPSEWTELDNTTLVPVSANMHKLKTRSDTLFTINSYAAGSDPRSGHLTLGASINSAGSRATQLNFTSLSHYWSMGVSGPQPDGPSSGLWDHPAYFIDGNIVADVSSYIMIGDNSSNIWSISGDVSNNTTCCLDNSQNIWQLTIDVSDNSNNIWLLSGDVSNNTTCCLDNSQNIWNLTIDVSDNSNNIFDLSNEVQDLSGEVWVGGGVHWVEGSDPLRALAAKSTDVTTLEFGGALFKIIMGADGTFSAGDATTTAAGPESGGNNVQGNVAIGYECICDASGGGQVALGRLAKTHGAPGDDAGSPSHPLGVSLYKPFVYTDGSGVGPAAGSSFAFGYDASGPALLAKVPGSAIGWYPLAGTNLSISGDMQNFWVTAGNTIYPNTTHAGAVHSLELQDPTLTTGTNAGALIMNGTFPGRSAELTIAPWKTAMPSSGSHAWLAGANGVSGAAMLVEMIGPSGSCPSGTYFTFGGKFDSVPAIFINNDVVADASSYIMIGDNSSNIWSISGDVSDNTTCCLDNSQNIWQLTIDVSDNSNNIWNLTIDVSDNSNNIFNLSGDVHNLSQSRWHADNDGIYYPDPAGTAGVVAIGMDPSSAAMLSISGSISTPNALQTYGGVLMHNLDEYQGPKSLYYDPHTGRVTYDDTSGGGGGGSSGPDTYYTLTKTTDDLSNNFFPDSSLNSPINVFDGVLNNTGSGAGIEFYAGTAGGGSSTASAYGIHKDGVYLISLNLHLTASGGFSALEDTSGNVRIVKGLAYDAPTSPLLIDVPLGSCGGVNASGGLEQTIMCTAPLDDGDFVSFWFFNGTQNTNVLADIGTTANFAKIGGGGSDSFWTQDQYGIRYPSGTDTSNVGIGMDSSASYSLSVSGGLFTSGSVKFANLTEHTTGNKSLFWDTTTNEVTYGDASGGTGGGGGGGKGGRMLVLGPRCDYSGSFEGTQDILTPWTSFSGPFSSSLNEGNNGTSGYIDAGGDGSGNAMVIGNFPSWSELGGATQFRLTLIGAGGGGNGGGGGFTVANRGGGGGAAEAVIDCLSENVYNHYFGDPKCELRLATRGQCCPHDPYTTAFAGTEPRWVTSSSGASYLWSSDGSGTSNRKVFSGYNASGASVSDVSQGLQAWLFTQCGGDSSTTSTLDGSGEGGGGWFDPSYAPADGVNPPIVRTYLGENQYSFKRFAMNGLGILDANNGARYGDGGIGNGFQGSGGGSALYIEWWPSDGGGGSGNDGGDDYLTLIKAASNQTASPPSFPDSSHGDGWVNIFAGTKAVTGIGEGIQFSGPTGDSSGYFTIENEGKYLISLNLHLTAAGPLDDTSCNILIVDGLDHTGPKPPLATVPLGMAGAIDYEGGLEQTITCVKPLVADDQVTFWLQNVTQNTNVIADIGTTANFARIGGGGERAVVVLGGGAGSVRGLAGGNTASGAHSVAIGLDCSAGGHCSVALGCGADASGDNQFVFGGTIVDASLTGGCVARDPGPAAPSTAWHSGGATIATCQWVADAVPTYAGHAVKGGGMYEVSGVVGMNQQWWMGDHADFQTFLNTNSDMKVKVTLVGGGGAGGGGSAAATSPPPVAEVVGGGGGGGGGAVTFYTKASALGSVSFTIGGGGASQAPAYPVDWPTSAASSGGDTSGSLFPTTMIARGGGGGACGGLTFGEPTEVLGNGGGGRGGVAVVPGGTFTNPTFNAGVLTAAGAFALHGGAGGTATRGTTGSIPPGAVAAGLGGWGGIGAAGGWGGNGGDGGESEGSSYAGQPGCVIFEWWGGTWS